MLATLRELSAGNLTLEGHIGGYLEALERSGIGRTLDRQLGDQASRGLDALVLNRQRQRATFLERWAYKSPEREIRDDRLRLIVSGAGGLLVQLGSWSARQYLIQSASIRERDARLTAIWDVLAAAASEGDGTISNPALGKVSALLQRAGATPDLCKRFFRERAPSSSLIDLRILDPRVFPPELRTAIGYVVVFSVMNKSGVPGLVDRRSLPDFLSDQVGLGSGEALDLVRRAQEITEEAAAELGALTSASIQLVGKVIHEVQISFPDVDPSHAWQFAEQLLSHDPDRQRREKTQALIKQGIPRALDLLGPIVLGKLGVPSAAAVALRTIAAEMGGGAVIGSSEHSFWTQLQTIALPKQQ